MTNKKEQTYVDKSEWPKGQWKDEPDRVSWVDAETGYDCLIRRNRWSGILCGYVSVGKNHPYYEKDGLSSEVDVDVHGGITYSDHCDGDVEFGICHLTKDEDLAWWFGFDCGHIYDIQPGMRDLYRFDYYEPCARYRSISYVISECESLAKQLKENEENET